MRIKRSLYLVALVALAFTACTKEVSYEYDDLPRNNNGNGNTNKQLEGIYDFVGLSAHTKSVETYKDFQISFFDSETIAISDFASTKTAGTIEFKSGVLYTKNFSYSIKGMLTGIVDGDTLLLQPVTYDVPTVNSQANYEKIGSDSIYLPQGGVIDMSATGGSVPMQSQPQGQKYYWSGDTLVISADFNLQKVTTDVDGVTNTVYSGNVVTKYKKRP